MMKKAPAPLKKNISPAKKPTTSRVKKPKPVIDSPASNSDETSQFQLRKRKPIVNEVNFFTLSVLGNFFMACKAEFGLLLM